MRRASSQSGRALATATETTGLGHPAHMRSRLWILGVAACGGVVTETGTDASRDDATPDAAADEAAAGFGDAALGFDADEPDVRRYADAATFVTDASCGAD